MDSMNGVFQGLDIAASGLSAELLRAEVVAANISNMNSTGGLDRDPYRRKGVIFEEMLNEAGEGLMAASKPAANGVQIREVYEDIETPFQMRHMPGHPDADGSGWVRTSNVDVFKEMVDMMAIERGFQANMSAMRTYRNMLQNTVRHIGRT